MDDNVFRDANGDESNVTRRDLRIDGNRANNGTGNGIRARPARNAGDGFVLENVEVRNVAGESLHFGGRSVRMEQIWVHDGGFNAIVAGLKDPVVRQFTIQNCDGFGFSVGHADSCTFEGIWVHNTSKVGINLEDADRYTLDGFAVGGSSPGDWKSVRLTGGKGHVVRNGFIDLTRESYDWGDPDVGNQTGVIIRTNQQRHNNGALIQAIRGSDLAEMVALSLGGQPIDSPVIRNLDGKRIGDWLDSDNQASNVTFDRDPSSYSGPTSQEGPTPGPWPIDGLPPLPESTGDDDSDSEYEVRVDGNSGEGRYSIGVTGEIQQHDRDDATIQDSDTVVDLPDGAVAAGHVNSGVDGFDVIGSIDFVAVSEGADSGVVVTVNGSEVDLSKGR